MTVTTKEINTLIDVEKMRREIRLDLAQEHHWDSQEKHWETQREHWTAQQKHWKWLGWAGAIAIGLNALKPLWS